MPAHDTQQRVVADRQPQPPRQVRRRPATQRARAIVQKARELGVLIGTDGPDDNIIKLRPAMIFSQRNADHLMQVMEAAFATA